MTHFDYCIPTDADDFFRMILPGVAAHHEPLLNALVGFAAYHRVLQDPRGKLQDFLKYYNKSVTLLLGLLKRKEKYDVATLLTILQLATIEVSLYSVTFVVQLILIQSTSYRSTWVTG